MMKQNHKLQKNKDKEELFCLIYYIYLHMDKDLVTEKDNVSDKKIDRECNRENSFKSADSEGKARKR